MREKLWIQLCCATCVANNLHNLAMLNLWTIFDLKPLHVKLSTIFWLKSGIFFFIQKWVAIDMAGLYCKQGMIVCLRSFVAITLRKERKANWATLRIKLISFETSEARSRKFKATRWSKKRLSAQKKTTCDVSVKEFLFCLWL